MADSLRDRMPSDFLPLEFVSLCNSLPLSRRQGDESLIFEMRLQEGSVSVLLTLSFPYPLSVLEQAAMPWAALRRGSGSKGLMALANSKQREDSQQTEEGPRKHIPPQAKPRDDYRPGRHLDYSDVKDPEPEAPSMAGSDKCLLF